MNIQTYYHSSYSYICFDLISNCVVYGIESTKQNIFTILYEYHPKQHQLLDTQFETYINDVKKTDCQATLRRLLKRGPPIYVSDKHAFPLAEENDTHVCKLWFALDGKERSAKLKGAVEGEERDVLWLELKEFIIEEGKEEGDEDDDEEDKK